MANSAADVPTIETLFDPARPYAVECTSMGATRRYLYTFSSAPIRTRAAQGAEGLGTARKCTVRIENTTPSLLADGGGPAAATSVEHSFVLLTYKPKQTYVLVCERLHGRFVQNPPLTMSLDYSKHSGAWRISTTYANMCGLFTLNNFQESFGPMAAVSCTHGTVTWCARGSERSLLLEARTIGGVCVNRFSPSDLDAGAGAAHDEPSDEKVDFPGHDVPHRSGIEQLLRPTTVGR